MEPIDLMGNIVLTLSTIIVFLLVLGLPLVRGIKSTKNFQRHGILSIVALGMQIVLVFVTMLPSFTSNSDKILSLSPLFSVNTWVHFVAGLVAWFSGFAYVLLWLGFSYSQMRCIQAKKYMMPTLVIWILAVITGALIHILQMF